MSGAHRMLERQEDERRTAVGIALKAKVLLHCENHPDQLILNADANIEEAYRIGNAMFTRGDLEGVFRNATRHDRRYQERCR